MIVTSFFRNLYIEMIDMITPTRVLFLCLLSLSLMAFWFVRGIYNFWYKFLARGKNIANRYGHGSWAVITGSAEGIGRGFAKELAQKGFNLVMIDKQSELLTETATTILQKHPQIQIRKIVTDFAHCQKESYFEYIADELAGLDISILINNAGFFLYGKFSEHNDQDLMNIVNVNVVPVMMLTKKLLPKLLARPKQSAIITLSSNESLHPYPNFTTIYGATKAFLTQFMMSLKGEHCDKIDFLNVTPALVSTRMTFFPPINFHTCGPDDVARSSLKALGTVPTTYGHWKHELFTPMVNSWEWGRKWMSEEMKVKLNAGKARMQKLA